MRPLLLLARTWKTIGFGVLVAGAGAISILRRQNSRPVVEFAVKLSKALWHAVGLPRMALQFTIGPFRGT